MRSRRTAGLSAEAVVTAVRVHADRVHDAVRRQGCPPSAAPEVVERTALELVARAAREDVALPVLVGQWFAAAASGGRGPGGEGLLVGRGPLADDAQQRLLAGVVQGTAEPGRTALLLADAYDLPLTTIAAALDTDPDDAAVLLGRTRSAVLPQLFTTGSQAEPGPAGHPVDEPALARLAAGGAPAPRDVTTARHVRACPRCRALLEAQEDVRRLLAGLSVVALPDEEREALLDRVADRAGALLPSEAALLAARQEEDDEPRRLLSPLPVLLSLSLAVVTGVGLGVLLSQTRSVETAQVRLLPVVTPPPLTPLPERPRREAEVPRPSTRVFTVRPTTPPPTTPPTSPPTTATSTAAPATASPTGAAGTVEVAPPSGPAGGQVVVRGTGWAPGSVVSVVYLRTDGTRTGSTASAETDEDGAFRTTLVTRDRQEPTGEHVVLVSDGTSEARAGYEAR